MLLIEKIHGNIRDINILKLLVEKVDLEWFELDKRLLRKTTDQGRDVGIKLNRCKPLQQGDVLWLNDQEAIVVEVLKTEAIVFEPQNSKEIALICYQLGHRHIQVFLDGNQILTPFDPTLIDYFKKVKIMTKVERRRLEHALQPVHNHAH
ncbi:MAG: urease accessory protein UreE [Desulfitobacteriaceae bacterium]